MFESPIGLQKICSLLETEGEATGVSVASGDRDRIGAERADTRPVPLDSRRLGLCKWLQIYSLEILIKSRLKGFSASSWPAGDCLPGRRLRLSARS